MPWSNTRAYDKDIDGAMAEIDGLIGLFETSRLCRQHMHGCLARDDRPDRRLVESLFADDDQPAAARFAGLPET